MLRPESREVNATKFICSINDIYKKTNMYNKNTIEQDSKVSYITHSHGSARVF